MKEVKEIIQTFDCNDKNCCFYKYSKDALSKAFNDERLKELTKTGTLYGELNFDMDYAVRNYGFERAFSVDISNSAVRIRSIDYNDNANIITVKGAPTESIKAIDVENLILMPRYITNGDEIRFITFDVSTFKRR